MADKQPVVQQHEVDRYRPVYYAAASGDFNPIHLDKELAQAFGLPGNILQGMCTMAWAVEAAVDAFGGDPGNLKSIKVRFSKPVKLDDQITCTATTIGPGKVQVTAVNQAGEDVLKNAEAEGTVG